MSEADNCSIIGLIFSRDRAMQLDAVLRSFFIHSQDSRQIKVNVLYRASVGQHAEQYQVLKTVYPQVNFVEQCNFRRDVLEILDLLPGGSFSRMVYGIACTIIEGLISLEQLPIRILPSILSRLRVKVIENIFPIPLDDNFVLFMVDDNLFVDEFSILDGVQALRDHPDAIGFSLRLGRNTSYSYSVDRQQEIPKFLTLDSGVLKYNWTHSEFDFAYPLEISSSLYRAKFVAQLLLGITFANPNELEFQMAIRESDYRDKMPFLLCAPQSLTFCNPVNIVQTFAHNRVGENIRFKSEHLAKLFDQGYRIRISDYSGFVPNSCHQEVELKFDKT